MKTTLVLLLHYIVYSVYFVSGQLLSDYGCIYSNLNVDCVSPKTIYSERAEYGQYEVPCSHPSGCCAPNDIDCKVDIETNFPDFMSTIRNACDNQTSCVLSLQAETLPTCPGIQQANYVHLFYRCYPEDPTTEQPTTVITTPTTTRTYPPTRPTTTTEKPDDGGLSAGVIVGIVFGVLLLIACAALITLIIYKKVNAPPPKKGRRQPGPNQRLQVHTNKGFASEEHIRLSVLDVKENGIPVHTRPKTDENPPVSDGKRKSKPVSAAESFRYAKEREDMLADKYRTQKPEKNSNSAVVNDINEQKKSKVKKKKPSNTSHYDSPKPVNVTENDYLEIKAGSPSGSETNNLYENVDNSDGKRNS